MNMFQLLSRDADLMYPRSVCRIRFGFALLETYASFMVIHSPDGSQWPKGLDTDAPPSYYMLFDHVTRMEQYSISSYLLDFSPFEKADIFSDQVVLFAIRLMRPVFTRLHILSRVCRQLI